MEVVPCIRGVVARSGLAGVDGQDGLWFVLAMLDV